MTDKVTEFQTAIQQDASLKEQLTAVAGDLEAGSKIAKEHGYDLSADELQRPWLKSLTKISPKLSIQASRPGNSWLKDLRSSDDRDPLRLGEYLR